MYVSTQDVYDTAGVDATVASTTVVTKFMQAAEKDVDRLTYTTYWSAEIDTTATSATTLSITSSSATWAVNAYTGLYVWIYGGTGSGQVRNIVSNTATALTIDRVWTVTPDSTSTFRIIYTATNPYIQVLEDGNGEKDYYLPSYPTRVLESVTIDTVAVTTSTIYNYANRGKLTLSTTSEKPVFSAALPQNIVINYWHGVYDIPQDVKRYVMLKATLLLFEAQMGGTYNAPSTVTLPEGSVSVGQAYINIKSTWDACKQELAELEPRLQRYPSVA